MQRRTLPPMNASDSSFPTDETTVNTAADTAETVSTGSETFASIKTDDVKTRQLKRAAEKRGGMSKLKQRYEKLTSHEDMKREHAMERMRDGLRKILSLHTPVELSSVCGCLHLKTQQKGNDSINQIIHYAGEAETFDITKIQQIFNFLWEGPLWEYLHTTGHPVYTMRPCPKRTIMELWESGGFLDPDAGFNPHFVVREVKKRYEWVLSKDIKDELDKMRKIQEKVKEAETKILSDHDYTNILLYFKKMAELRRVETVLRDKLITEVEAAKSRVDSSIEIGKLNREHQAEAEQLTINVVGALNTKLAHVEFLHEDEIKQRMKLEQEIQRLTSVVQSYIDVEKDRVRPHGGAGKVQPLRLKHPDQCSKTVQDMHTALQEYRDLRDSSDDLIRQRATDLQKEIGEMRGGNAGLYAEMDKAKKDAAAAEVKTQRYREEITACARTIMKKEIKQETSSSESWGNSARLAAKVGEYELQLQKLKPLLKAGLYHSSKPVVDICFSVMTLLDVLPQKEYKDMLDNYGIKEEEQVSKMLVSLDKAKMAAKAKKGAKSSGKGKKDDASVKTKGSAKSAKSGKSGGTEAKKGAKKSDGKKDKKDAKKDGKKDTKKDTKKDDSKGKSSVKSSVKKKK